MTTVSIKAHPVLATFLADAHALSSHWIYDSTQIALKLPADKLRTTLFNPLSSYHKSKVAGDFTHYGDQTLILLNSLSKPFDLSKFKSSWTAGMGSSSYSGYIDQATKVSLAQNSGSDSSDISGASRIAPLILVSTTELEFVANSVTQTRMTHDNKVVIGTSAFIAHCLWILTHSTQMPSQVIPSVAKLLATTYPDTVQLVNQGIARLADFKTQLAKGKDGRFEGIACSVDGALPLAIQIVLNCEKGSLMDALVVNALIGGDTAARGMIVGMLISPRTGVPTSMLGQVKAYNQIQSRITELQNL